MLMWAQRLGRRSLGLSGIEALVAWTLVGCVVASAVMALVDAYMRAPIVSPTAAVASAAIALVYLALVYTLARRQPITPTSLLADARRRWLLSLLDLGAGLSLFFLLGANGGLGAPLRLAMIAPLAVRLRLRWALLLSGIVALAVTVAPFAPPFSSDPLFTVFRRSNYVAANAFGVLFAAVILHTLTRIAHQRDSLLREREALLVEEIELRADAERRAQESRALVEVARAISGRLAPQDVLEEVHQQLARIVPFDACFVAVRDEGSPEHELRYAIVVDGGRRYREEDGRIAARPEAGPEAYTTRALTTGTSIMVLRTPEEIEARQQRQSGGRERIGDRSRPSASLLYTPIRVGDDVLGVISVQSYQVNAYHPHHLELLEAVAGQTAVALQNARLVTRAGEADALRSIARLKDELVATVSHELRTPLTYVSGYSELLSAGKIAPERAQRTAAEIYRAAQHMQRIMDDLLDLERLQAGTIALEVAAHPVAEAISSALVLLGEQAEGHEIEVKVPDELPPFLADGHYLVQILLNLLVNAIRYSPPGSPITVGAAPHGADRVLLWVRDHGYGLTAEQCERIFEKFYRGPIELTGRYPGAGLGLAICRGLVEAHGTGCRIWAESDGPGTGSCFYVTLPAEVALTSSAQRQ